MKADSNQLSAGALEGAPEFYGVVGPKEYRMQFQVKGQDYFLEYIDEEHSWFVFTHTGDGLQRIPVYVDGKKVRGASTRKLSPKLSS